MLYGNASKSGRETVIHRQLGYAFCEMKIRKETASTSWRFYMRRALQRMSRMISAEPIALLALFCHISMWKMYGGTVR
jgi:hypothetical protein